MGVTSSRPPAVSFRWPMCLRNCFLRSSCTNLRRHRISRAVWLVSSTSSFIARSISMEWKSPEACKAPIAASPSMSIPRPACCSAIAGRQVLAKSGMSLDVSYNKRHYIDEDAFDYYSGATATDGTTSAFAPETIGGIQYPGSRERTSVNFSTQWRPNSHTEVFAELFYSRYKNPHSVNFLIGLPGNSNPVTNLTTITDPNGNVLDEVGRFVLFRSDQQPVVPRQDRHLSVRDRANRTLGNFRRCRRKSTTPTAAIRAMGPLSTRRSSRP